MLPAVANLVIAYVTRPEVRHVVVVERKITFAKACRSAQGPPASTDELNELYRGEAASVAPTQYVTLDSSEEELFTLQDLHSDNNSNNAKMSLLLNGFPTTSLVDSGASVNVLPLHVYQKVKPQGFQAGANVDTYLPIW